MEAVAQTPLPSKGLPPPAPPASVSGTSSQNQNPQLNANPSVPLGAASPQVNRHIPPLGGGIPTLGTQTPLGTPTMNTSGSGVPGLGLGLGALPALGGAPALGTIPSLGVGSNPGATDLERLAAQLGNMLNGLNLNSTTSSASFSSATPGADLFGASRFGDLTNPNLRPEADPSAGELLQVLSIGQQLEGLAQSVRNKAVELERIYVSGSADDYDDQDVTTTYTMGVGSPNPRLMNAEAKRRWRNAEYASSGLLSGPSYLEHVPGAQYCVDAGLHHHHKVNVVRKRRQRKLPPWNSMWFHELELALRDLATKLSGAYTYFQQVTTTQRSQFLRTLSDLISQVMQALANAGSGSAAEVAALRAKVAHLEALLRNRPAGIPITPAFNNDAEVAELRRQIELRDRRIAELEAQLQQQQARAPNSIYVDVKQADPRVEEHRTRAIQGASCLWASGAVNQSTLGLPANPPADIIIEPPSVQAVDAQGHTLDMKVVYRRQ